MAASSGDDDFSTYAESAYLRLALAENDDDLQKFVDRELCTFLERASSSPQTLQQAKEMMGHLNRRLRAADSVRLPVRKLIAMLGDPQCGATLKHLVGIYLRMGKSRETPEFMLGLLPAVLDLLEGVAEIISLELLAFILPAFSALSRLKDADWPSELCAARSDTTQSRLAEFCRMVLLHNSPSEEKANGQERRAFMAMLMGGSAPTSSNSISPAEEQFVKSRIDEVDSVPLAERKQALVKVLGVGRLLSLHLSFPLLLLASADSSGSVQNAAESSLKRLDRKAALADKRVVEKLLRLYLGHATGDPASSRPPVSVEYGAEIVVALSKSPTAAVHYMDNIKVVFEALNASLPNRVQLAAADWLLEICRSIPPTMVPKFVPALFKRIRGLIDQFSIPAVVCVLFRCLSALGRAYPSLPASNLECVQDAFERLVERADDVASAASDCLVDWLPTFENQRDPAVLSQLRAIVVTSIGAAKPRARVVALRYAELFVTNINESAADMPWLLVEAAVDPREDLRTAATRLLEQVLHKCSLDLAYLIRLFTVRIHPPVRPTTASSTPTQQPVAAVPPQVQAMAATFLLAALNVQSIRLQHGEKVTPEHISAVRLNEDASSRLGWIHAVLRKEDSILKQQFAETLLRTVDKTTNPFIIRATAMSLKLIGSASVLRAEPYISTVRDWAVGRAASALKQEEASAAADLAALMEPDPQKCVQQLTKELEHASTASPVCWRVVSLLVQRGESVDEATRTNAVRHILNRLHGALSENAFTLLDLLSASTAELLRGTSPIAILNADDASKLLTAASEAVGSRKSEINPSTRESLLKVIAFLPPFSTSETDAIKHALEAIMAVGAGNPQPHLQFAAGECLVHVSVGSKSSVHRDLLSQSEQDRVAVADLPEPELGAIVDRLAGVLSSILDDKSFSANQHLRRASQTWLYEIVTKCTSLCDRLLKPRFDDIQAVFLDGLTENDDFAQDVSSRGLGELYQLADADTRKRLVSALMGCFIEGQKPRTKIDGDTAIFQPGQLRIDDGGGSLTTYKELCELATHMNKPDLVYKFLQLSRHNTQWASKKGAAVGFTVLFEQAKAELEPFVGELAPKLFRYRYDPDPAVSASMRAIWDSITAGRRGTVDEFANPIADELIAGLTNVHWRVRESSCVALADLLSGHENAYVRSRIGDIIHSLLRVVDDVKETVRIAAAKTLAVCGRSVLRILQSTSDSAELMRMLVDKATAVGSTSVERQFSLSLIVEASRTAATSLVRDAPLLVGALLDSLAHSEHAAINYLAVRASSEQQEQIDGARTQVAASSDAMTAAERLCSAIDVAQLPELCGQLGERLRGAMALPTRTGAAHLLVLLATTRAILFKDSPQVVGRLLRVLIAGLSDRNRTVRVKFSQTIAYLARHSTPTQMNSIAEQARTLLVSESEEDQRTARALLGALAAHSSEVCAANASLLLPPIYFAKFVLVLPGDVESREKASEWAELWSELAPITSAVLTLHFDVFAKYLFTLLRDSSVYATKSQAARALSDLYTHVGSSLTSPQAEEQLSSLLAVLSTGGVWSGKASVAETLSALCQHAPTQLNGLAETKKSEASALIAKEAGRGRRDALYKKAAMQAAAHWAAGLRDEAVAETVYSLLEQQVATVCSPPEEASSDEDNTNETTRTARVAALRQLEESLVETLGIMLPLDSHAPRLWQQIAQLIASDRIVWMTRLQHVQALDKALERHRATVPAALVTDLSASLASLQSAFAGSQRTLVEVAGRAKAKLENVAPMDTS